MRVGSAAAMVRLSTPFLALATLCSYALAFTTTTHRVRDSVDSVDFEPVHVRTASQDAAVPPSEEDAAPSEVPEEEEVHRGSMYSEAESEESMLPPPPPLPLDPASGRQSPGRYIHGQPLHNVVEAEEEEEE